MSTIRELRNMNNATLYNQLEDQKESLFNLRFQKSFGQLEDPNALRDAKRDIARILTLLREREIEGQKGEGDDNA